jgi:4-amino-4-deoxy-L-arabinose transferase-like glycosyltransferase
LSIVAAIFYVSVTLYYKLPKNDRKNRVLVMGMIMALTTYFVHAFLNNFLDTDKAAVPIWAMCAMVIVMGMQLKEKSLNS